jgi:uncharacterized protein YdeI (YjbR/CyaY-like superfamily)
VNPIFFKDATAFRRWLEKHHDTESEVWLGFYKAAAKKAGISYKDSVDEALCFGWIDGVRKGLDAESYVQRFSPRTAKSYWSAVNTKRAHELIAADRMHPAGQAAFDRRDAAATARYSFEREAAELQPADLARFRKNSKAWGYFESEAPWYRRVAVHWVVSAKREETRERRMATLIEVSRAGRRIGAVPSPRRPQKRRTPPPSAKATASPPKRSARRRNVERRKKPKS